MIIAECTKPIVLAYCMASREKIAIVRDSSRIVE
jgi:hypothetical protein